MILQTSAQVERALNGGYDDDNARNLEDTLKAHDIFPCPLGRVGPVHRLLSLMRVGTFLCHLEILF